MTINDLYNDIILTCWNDDEYAAATEYVDSMVDEFIEAVYEIGYQRRISDMNLSNGLKKLLWNVDVA